VINSNRIKWEDVENYVMRSFIIYRHYLHQIGLYVYYSGQIKDDEMDGAFSSNERDEKCVRTF
jgi:hypothetical protein